MSRRHNPYIFYTEYYIISGAYQVINVVNGILTYSASYSDNMKEYLRNQVASKQVALNELIRIQHDARVNANPDNDLDEDGFVVVKMRKPKPKNANPNHTHSDRGHSVVSSLPVMPMPMHNESSSPIPFQSESESNINNINIKEGYNVLSQKVIEHVMRDMISDVIVKIDTMHKEVILRN